MDLKWLLVRRITLVALACVLTGSAFALVIAARDARQKNTVLAELAVRQLDLQLLRVDRGTDIPTRFPDWDLVSGHSLQPGQCVEFQSTIAARNRSSCAGVEAHAADAPHWFFAAYNHVLNDHLTAVRPLLHRGAVQGAIVASFDPAATAGFAWAAIAPLFGLSAVLAAALCLMTYYVVDHALRPAKDILTGLNRLAAGDLKCRLPAFELAELNRISQVFNAVSADLEKATAERTDLARRLVDTQEQERRHLARELHDDVAQKLAALNAVAACVRKTAQADAPLLADDTRQLEKMASELMMSLRRTLTYLRPQEIDDLGLLQSLKALVEQHNDTARGRTVYSLAASGQIDEFRAETSAHVYRIVQEALNNAAKHANARRVQVQLTETHSQHDKQIRLCVTDDGVGVRELASGSQYSGAGLIGMRERVTALNGTFAAGALASGGFGLQIEFPAAQQGA